MNKLGRNARCHCGSGRKYKSCHWSSDRQNITVAFDNGLVATIESVTAALVTMRSSRVPEWLLRIARDAVHKASEPGASDQRGLMAVLLVAAAGEAVLNWLLEALVSSEKFLAKEGGNSLERASMAKKWIKLSELLDIKPNFKADAPPLKNLLETIEVRNSVMHFKYGQNVRRTKGMEIKGVKKNGSISIPMRPLLESPQQLVSGEIVEDRIAPSRAAAYFATLTNVLQVVLPVYPDKKIAKDIQDALTEEVWFTRKRLSALWEVLAQAQVFAEKALASLMSLTTPAQEAAAGALHRLPQLLRSIRLLVENGQPLEAQLLVSSLTKMAVTISWVALKEEHAIAFRGESVSQIRAWLEVLRRHEVSLPEEDMKRLDALCAERANAQMPPIEQRVTELADDMRQIYDFTYRLDMVSMQNELRLAKLVLEGKPGTSGEDALVIAAAATGFLIESAGQLLKLDGTQALLDALQNATNV